MFKLDQMSNDLLKTKARVASLDFPDFLLNLRRSLSLTRETVIRDLDIPYLRLFYLEEGEFRKMPKEDLLKKISEYYGVSLQDLSNKAKDFLDFQIIAKRKAVK